MERFYDSELLRVRRIWTSFSWLTDEQSMIGGYVRQQFGTAESAALLSKKFLNPFGFECIRMKTFRTELAPARLIDEESGDLAAF